MTPAPSKGEYAPAVKSSVKDEAVFILADEEEEEPIAMALMGMLSVRKRRSFVWFSA